MKQPRCHDCGEPMVAEDDITWTCVCGFVLVTGEPRTLHAEYRGMSFGEGTKVLRCHLCGAEAGVYHGDAPPDPRIAIVRCVACAATEAAEAITEAAAKGGK